MMQNIWILKSKNSIIILLFLMLLCNSCCDNKKVIEKVYYYVEVSSSFDSIPYNYEAYHIIDINDKRELIRYIYNPYYENDEGKILTRSSFYKIKNDGLIKYNNILDTVGYDYLCIKKDTCIVWKHPNEIMNVIAQQKHCFIGEEVLKVGEDEIYTYKFLVKVGSNDCTDNVQYISYYDKSFILVKYEKISIGYPRLERIDTIPLEFRVFLDSIMKIALQLPP